MGHLQPGDWAPEFELADQDAKPYRLKLADTRWRLLIFLRHRH